MYYLLIDREPRKPSKDLTSFAIVEFHTDYEPEICEYYGITPNHISGIFDSEIQALATRDKFIDQSISANQQP